jgi:antitoxin (DNA-binding transcriptional repressor) of toxin-antitoxin stability system
MLMIQIRVAALGRGRKWAESVAESGEAVEILDAAGTPIAYLIPATEPITEELLEQMAGAYAARHGWKERERAAWVREQRWMVGRGRYHRVRDVFLIPGTAPG